MRKIPALLAVSTLLLCATACVETPVTKLYQGQDIATLQTYHFNVAEVMIVEDSKPTDTTNDLEVQYGISPMSELRKWVDQRMKAEGTQGSLSVIVKDANVVTRPLPVTKGFMGYFKNEQAEEMQSYLHALVSIEGSADGTPPAEFTVAVRSSYTLPENPSKDERGRIYRAMIEQLMDAFDKEAEKQLGAYFKPFTR